MGKIVKNIENVDVNLLLSDVKDIVNQLVLRLADINDTIPDRNELDSHTALLATNSLLKDISAVLDNVDSNIYQSSDYYSSDPRC